MAGEPTRAGSRIFADAAPATADAPVVRRLRAAGAVIVAKTNMSEFAFSGVGMNPHYGTPGNPADRARVPGGSSSGAAVAAADHMCEIAIGTDTGGSTRIPAALCGIVGYKPSKWRVPTEGAFPLSYTLDSIGPMARSVADCARADAVMAGEDPVPLEPVLLAGLRFGIPLGLLLKDFDNTVGTRFAAAKKEVRQGRRAAHRRADSADRRHDGRQRQGGLRPGGGLFDPSREPGAARGRVRSERARAHRARHEVLAADYVELSRERARLVRAMDAALAQFDALVMPTTPIIAPTIAEMKDSGQYSRPRTWLLLRNTSTWNFFDTCRDLDPISARGAAGRTDAGRAQRPRPAPVSRSRPRSSATLAPERDFGA